MHGDGFTCFGARPQLQWFEAQLRSKYELTVGSRLGPGKDDDHAGLVLNRVVRWTSSGLEYEADPRQAAKLIRDTELQGANAVTTPVVKPLPHQLEQDQTLSVTDFTRFRGQAARANYLGPDRPDIIYAAKEVCRGMSSPTDLHQAGLKRMARYLRSRPRMVFKFDYQSADHRRVRRHGLGRLPTIPPIDVMRLWGHIC